MMAGQVCRSTELKAVILHLLLNSKVLSYDVCRFRRLYTELEPNSQKFITEALGVFHIHLVVSSRAKRTEHTE